MYVPILCANMATFHFDTDVFIHILETLNIFFVLSSYLCQSKIAYVFLYNMLLHAVFQTRKQVLSRDRLL